jgi:flagellar biosynthesis chaperone FliJ
MNDFFEKLNVLARARITSLLSGDPAPTQRGQLDPDPTAPQRYEKLDLDDAEREAAELRKHVETALNTQDNMQHRLDALHAQIAEFDRQADNALLHGNEALARSAVAQMQRVRHTADTLESELKSHRNMTSQLITQVNQLETIISEKRHAQATLPPAPSTIRVMPTPPQPADTATPVKITVNAPQTPIQMPTVPDRLPPTPQELVKDELEKAQVEDDLAARRKRLSDPTLPPPTPPKV